MAAVSTLQYGRQKRSLYGKASKSSWNTTFFDDSDDELAAPAPAPTAKTASQRNASVKDTYTIQKAAVKQALSPKTAKTKPKAAKQDTFDVPSSGDESSPPAKIVQKPVFRPKRALVDDSKEEGAPWERQHASAPGSKVNGVAKLSRPAVTGPDAQLRSDLAGVVKSSNAQSTRSHSGKEATSQGQTKDAPAVKTQANASSATARLAARKRVAEPTVSSTEELPMGSQMPNSAYEATPRKRARTTTVMRGSGVDVAMAKQYSLPRCDSTEVPPRTSDADTGIYDFPDSSADESSKPAKQSRSPKVTKKPMRRSKLTSSSTRSTPRKGVSAPARLAEMLPMDSDITESSIASPAASVSRDATPQQPSMPPSGQTADPNTAIRSGGHMTPKQAHLWNKLLPSQNIAPSPSALAMKELTISGQRRKATEVQSASRRLTKNQSDVQRRRTRLVDRLKASAQSSSEDESSDAASDVEDTDMADNSEVAAKPALLRQESSDLSKATAPASQSQPRSQVPATTAGGLKRTYASQRSHLAEDNLEDDLMAGLVEDTPKQPIARARTFGRSQTNSQKDAFDLDDSDDDGPGTGAIRTIHELRAAGRSIRGTEDIEQLLEDIENHAASHKSRRRSALIELATKLADKNFAGRFVGQGCDLRLAQQCTAPADDIANFVLAAAVTLLLASDPPEHTLRTLNDNGVAPWLASLLPSAIEIGKLAKNRQYNMARVTQTSLVKLAELLQHQQSLWSEEQPTAVSTRLVALKALDLSVSKLRRTGNKSELLASDQLKLLLDTEATGVDSQIDTELSISVLESLSTASLALTWEPSILQRVAQILTSLDPTSQPRRHTLFLTLRLCLNLTTDNARNCALLATESSVPYLLQTVLDGFTAIVAETEEDKRTIALDLLVLALGILINLFEHSAEARKHATNTTPNTATPDLLPSLVQTFTAGQQRMLDAESVEESISNVAFGYLAVMLANLCQDASARATVAAALPGKGLGMLADAVEEFVLYHQQVDRMNFEGEEGGAVWGAFTEKLRMVLERVRAVEGVGV